MRVLRLVGRICVYMLTALVAFLLVCNLYVIATRKFTGEQPTIFGFSSAVVISGSMSGSIEVNDMIIIRQMNSYEPGDIITFSDDSFLVTHRIVGESADGFITKGDANNVEDSETVTPEMVIGKVVLVIPKIGWLMEYMRTPLGMTCLVLIGFLLIEIPVLMERRRKNATIGGNDNDRSNE